MNIQLFMAEDWMIPEIIDNLRGDQVELVTERNSITQDLRVQISISSHCMVGMADGKIAVVWGVLTPSITSSIGVVWAATTNLADEYPLVFARRSKIALDEIKKSYSELIGYVSVDYKRSVRWLKWLGFTIDPPRKIHGQTVRVIRMKGDL